MRPVSMKCTILACALISLLMQARNPVTAKPVTFSSTPKTTAVAPTDYDWCCDESMFLRLHKLCVQRAKADWVDAHRITTRQLCTQSTLCTSTHSSDHVRANSVQTMNLCTPQAQVSTLCANCISTTNLNIAGELCTKFKAFAEDLVTHTQASGDLVLFDTIVDDPSGSFTNNGSYTSYTAPIAGYYIVSTSVGIQDIVGRAITGTPIPLIQVLVNGNAVSQLRSAILAFSLTQESCLTTLIRLNIGDVVTIKYGLLTQDPTLGEIVYNAVLSVGGSALTTYFAIHYLSSSCDIECPPCTTTPCSPVNISCNNHCAPWCDEHAAH